MQTKRQEDIFGIILQNEPIGRPDIFKKLSIVISYATLFKELVKLRETNFIYSDGRGPSTKYKVNHNELFKANIDIDTFLKIDINNKRIFEKHDPFIFDTLSQVSLHSGKEISLLAKLTKLHKKKKVFEVEDYLKKRK